MLNGSTIRIRISSCYRVHKIVIYNIIMIILLLFFYIFLQITRVIPLFLLKNASHILISESMILKECGKPTVSQSLSLKELYSAPGESRSNKEFPTKLTVFLLLFPKTSIFSLRRVSYGSNITSCIALVLIDRTFSLEYRQISSA